MKQEVKINYYDTFRCIADQCSLTCCQEWRIAVDEETKQKWTNKSIKEGTKEREDTVSLCDCLKEEENGGSIIGLNKEKKCPFLNQDKLCKLVIQLGDEFLSDTCNTFPRQINEFEDRIEYSLTSCCPAVVDLMRINEPQQFCISADGKQLKLIGASHLLYEVREMMLEIMKSKQGSLTQKLLMIFYGLLELLEHEDLNANKIKNTFSEKQMNSLRQAIEQMAFSPIDSLLESNELFLDVVENYRKQGLYTRFLENIARIAEQLEEDYEEEVLLEKYQAFIETIVPYKQLFKHYLLAEIIGNSLMPESNLEDMVVAFEWMSLEYSVMRQCLFLKWLEQGEEALSYEVIRDYISVIARVTGYDAEDINEYLENSFESVIWEWGYMAMVIGNNIL